jgi:predicted membrane channel-forming protein YqfA (hemolysin III family)
MGNATNAVLVSVLYILVAVGLTIWLSSMLYRNGLDLLADRRQQQPLLAQATSRLLVIGFALFTLGYAFLLLRIPDEMETMNGVEALQFLTTRLGVLLVSLGLIHLLNTLMFLRFRRSRAEEEEAKSPRRPRRGQPSEETPSEQARQRRGQS